MMVLSVIWAIVWGFVALRMLHRATLCSTKRVALVAAAMFLIEVAATGLLSVMQFPILTAVLTLARLTVLLCCVKAMRHDAAVVRAKAKKLRMAKIQRKEMALCA